MSRNLCQSSCCNNIIRLSDLRGKPIEFRRYGNSPPVIGTRWDCSTCSRAYFAWWREGTWDYHSNTFNNFVIDLSYYESFNDEPGDLEELNDPRYLCVDNAEDVQDVW